MLAQPCIAEAESEFVNNLLKSGIAFLAHLLCEGDTLIGSNDGGPILANHAFGIPFLDSHDSVAYTLLELRGSNRAFNNRIKNLLMQEGHDFF